MRFLRLAEIVELHRRVIELSGGDGGLRDLRALESATAQPRATFDGTDLYPTLIEKAAALGFSLALNHAFIDGNKRVAHAAMATFLALNGVEIVADVDDAERVMLALAAGELSREHFADWVRQHAQ